MSRPSLLTVLAAVLLSGCGYVGEPLPPALKRPMRVVDLEAVERGQNIAVQFTLPVETTEGLPIEGAPDVEVRYGLSAGNPFRHDEWERNSERVPSVPADKPVVHVNIPVQKFIGKDVIIGVRVHGPHGRDIGWSALATVPVVSPLPAPTEVQVADVAAGVRLDWHAAAPQFRVFRRMAGETTWAQIGTSDKPFFVDTESAYGKSYEYYVQTIEKTRDSFAESEVSNVVKITPKDTFPPAVPAGVTAVPAAKSIELLWDRGVEKDLAGYRVYRDGKRITETLPSPAFSDKTAQPGTRYRYQVSAIDNATNESQLSQPVEAVIP